MGVASGCGEQEVGVASGSGWNLWVWLLGVVLRRYIDFLILLIPTPLVSVLFCSSIPTSFFILLIIESYGTYARYNYEHHFNVTCTEFHTSRILHDTSLLTRFQESHSIQGM